MAAGQQLSKLQIIGYGTGHIFNDICASMWFTYLLLFFQEVLFFKTASSGQLLLVGQIADGISTLIIGLLAEKLSAWLICRKYGSRKTWHLAGTVCVLLSFPFIFLPCIGCRDSAVEWKMLYYCCFIIVFQFGWACVQISHLALITQLSDDAGTRTTLTSVRYGATVGSNILVYAVTWAFLGIGSTQTSINGENVDDFRNIMFAGVALGLTATIIFHVTVKEQLDSATKQLTSDAHTKEGPTGGLGRFLVWFQSWPIYLVAGVYISTRLFINISQSYISLYLQESLKLGATYVAVIPLVMYLSGLFTSFIVKPLHRLCGETISWTIGAAAGILSATWIFLDGSDFFVTYGIYAAAVLYGSVNSIFLITSLALTAELIGERAQSAPFIYGVMSLLEKVANGGMVVLIQSLIPCLKVHASTTLFIAEPPPDLEQPCFKFYRSVLFSATGGAAVLGAIFCVTILFCGGIRSKRPEKLTKNEGIP